MTMLQTISAICKILFQIVKNYSEQNERTRLKREQAIKEAKNAIEDKDASALNLAIGKLNRL
jgi:hypothetical protein